MRGGDEIVPSSCSGWVEDVDDQVPVIVVLITT